MKTMKNIYEVITNNRDKILVKATQDELEKLFSENKIFEYTLARLYKVSEVAL